MAVSIELHNTGDSSIGAEIQALVEHHLSDTPGDWRVSIVGSRENDMCSVTTLSSAHRTNTNFCDVFVT
jgi:hypothetical protein